MISRAIGNANTYSAIITLTITNTPLLIIFTIAEYIFQIFPSMLSLRGKYQFYNQKIQKLEIEQFFFRFYVHTDNVPTLTIIILLLVIPFMLFFFLVWKNNKRLYSKFFVNFYNLFFFRYLSYYFFDSLSYAVLELNMINKSYFKTAVSFFVIFIQMTYFYYCFTFISVYSVFTKITNEKIVESSNRYCYDKFATDYDKFFLLIKLVIAYDINYTFIKKDRATFVNLSNSILVYVLTFWFLLAIFKERVILRKNLVFFHCNFSFSVVRHLIFFFNLCIVAFQLFFNLHYAKYLEFYCVVFSFIVASFVVFFFIHFFELSQMYHTENIKNEDYIIFLLANIDEYVEESPEKLELQSSISRKISKKSVLFYKKLIQIIYENHLVLSNCTDSNCKICDLLLNDRLPHYSKIYQLYKLNKGKNTPNYYSKFIDFLYFKIENNVFKFYKSYSLLSKDTNIDFHIKNFITYIAYETQEKESEMNVSFISEIVNINCLTKYLTNTLNSFYNFITINFELKTSFELLNLSTQLKKLKNVMHKKLVEAANKTGFDFQIGKKGKKLDQNQHTIQTILKFNVTVLRYVTESLLNEQFHNLNILDIEALDEYLSYHYFNDKSLTLSTEVKKTRHEFKVVKFTEFLSLSKKTPEYLTDCFPPEIAKYGNELLYNSIKKCENQNKNFFSFLFLKSNFIELFKYSYTIAKCLIEQSIVIYGCYTYPVDRIILVKKRNADRYHLKSKLSYANYFMDFSIMNFSQSLYKIFLIHPLCIDYLRRYIMKDLRLKDFFDSIMLGKSKNLKKKGEFQEKLTNKKEGYHDFFQCEMNYGEFGSKMIPLLEEILQKEQKKEEGDIFDIEKIKEKAKIAKEIIEKRKARHVLITFVKLFNITEDLVIYQIDTTSAQKGGKRFSTIKGTLDIKTKHAEGEKGEEEKDFDSKDLKLIPGYTVMTSASSANESTSTKLSVAKTVARAIKEKSKVFKYIQSEHKKLNYVSFISVLINIGIIIISIVFLVIQIQKTRELKVINNIYFDFNTVRNSYSNTFLGLMGTFCLSQKRDNKCDNAYKKFLNKLQVEINVDKNDFDLYEFIFQANKIKIETLKVLFSNLKKTVYKNNYKNFMKVLEGDVTIAFFEQVEDNLIQKKTALTMSLGLETYFNSMWTLIGERLNGGEDYREVPINVITSSNGTLSYENLYDLNLSLLQHEIYKIMINYVYFSKNFQAADESISSDSLKIRKINIVITVIFMLGVFICNFIIFLINYKYISIAYVLFKKIIFNLILKVENQNIKENLKIKINCLINLAKFYHDNPVELVQKIKKEEKKINQVHIKINQKEAAQSALLGDNKNLLDKKKNELEEFLNLNKGMKTSYQMKGFTSKVMLPLMLKNTFLFFMFFIIIVIYDAILIMTFNSVFNLQDYALVSASFEKDFYLVLGLSHFIHELNVTEDRIGSLIGLDVSEDLVVNTILRSILDQMREINKIQAVQKLPGISDYVVFNCDVYTSIKDSLISGYSGKKLNGTEIAKKICEHYYFMLEENDDIVYEDFIVSVRTLENRYSDRDYDTMYRFSQDELLYKTYMYMMFYIRPFRKFVNVSIMTPVVSAKFNYYYYFVWIYLILTLVLESIVFVLNKCIISRKIVVIQNKFFIFEKCIS